MENMGISSERPISAEANASSRKYPRRSPQTLRKSARAENAETIERGVRNWDVDFGKIRAPFSELAGQGGQMKAG